MKGFLIIAGSMMVVATILGLFGPTVVLGIRAVNNLFDPQRSYIETPADIVSLVTKPQSCFKYADCQQICDGSTCTDQGVILQAGSSVGIHNSRNFPPGAFGDPFAPSAGYGICSAQHVCQLKIILP